MKPIEFKEQNIVYAKNQPPYLPLPAYEHDNRIIHCWKLDMVERIKILLTGKLWIQVLIFHMSPQPIKPSVDKPLMLYANSQK